MAIIQKGIKVDSGVREPKPIVGAPEGRQRLRMRNTSAARLFVKTSDGTRCFILLDDGDTWRVDEKMEQGRNLRK